MQPAKLAPYAVGVSVAVLAFTLATSWRGEEAGTTVLGPVPTVPDRPTTLPSESAATEDIPSTSFPVSDTPSDAAADELLDEAGDPVAPGTPALPAPVEPPADDAPPDLDAMPEVNPVTIEDAETTFYLPANSTQAAILGLRPEQVRTWGMTFSPSGDAAEDHRRIVEGLRASGVDVQVDMLEGSSEGFGLLGGGWNGYTVNVIVGNWTTITVNMIDG